MARRADRRLLRGLSFLPSLAGSSVLFATLFHHPAVGILSAAMVVVTSLLMISNIPYRHFGQVLWPTMPRGLKMLIFILMIVFVCFTFAHKCYRPAFVWWCFGISLAYALYGINWPFCKHDTTEQAPKE